MTRARKIFVRVALGLLIAGSLFAIGSGQERWPFSPYPMFAGAYSRDALKVEYLVGVEALPPHGEVIVPVKTALAPFELARLRLALLALLARDDGGRAASRALSGLLAFYERRRASGEITGPPLCALRLYRAVRPLPADAGEAAREVTRAEVDPRAERTLLVESSPTDEAPTQGAAASRAAPAPAPASRTAPAPGSGSSPGADPREAGR